MTPSQQAKAAQTMTLKQMIEKGFGGCRIKAAIGANISVENLNMCISRGYDVAELKNGDYVMLTSKTKTFKVSG